MHGVFRIDLIPDGETSTFIMGEHVAGRRALGADFGELVYAPVSLGETGAELRRETRLQHRGIC